MTKKLITIAAALALAMIATAPASAAVTCEVEFDPRPPVGKTVGLAEPGFRDLNTGEFYPGVTAPAGCIERKIQNGARFEGDDNEPDGQ